MDSNLNPNESFDYVLKDLDPLVIAIGLAVASLAPGPAGEAGAIAAIAFDTKRRRWDGVVLSAASMIPVVGYVPAVVKLGWLVFLLNQRLKRVESSLSDLTQSPEHALKILEIFGKYQRSIPKWKITRKLRERVDRIVASVTPTDPQDEKRARP
ncbi:MAG: hypothetical protein ABSE51_01595 [Terracidiphilus sp.]|jgi:hypothetical protein